MDLEDAVARLEDAGALGRAEAEALRERIRPRAALPARPPAWSLAGLAAGLLVGVLLVALEAAEGPLEDPRPFAGAILLLGAVAMGVAVAWRTDAVTREAVLLGGATLWATLDLFHPGSPVWATVPGFVLVWGSLALAMGPWTRIAFATLSVPATAGLLLGAGFDASATSVLSVFLLAGHLVLVWLAEPMTSPLRRIVPVPLIAGSAAVLLTVTVFLFSGISIGRLTAFAAAAGAFVASTRLLSDPRLRAYSLAGTWRRRTLRP